KRNPPRKLDAQLALEILPTLDDIQIERPILPVPPPAPSEELAKKGEQEPKEQGSQPDLEVTDRASSQPVFSPSYSPSYSSRRSSSSRNTPGTEVHVRGYTRRNWTYVAPFTRSRPGSGGGGRRR